MSRRVLSVHQGHELLLKLERAGLTETDAQSVIGSRGNTLAKRIIEVIRGSKEKDFFHFAVIGMTLNELAASYRSFFAEDPDVWKDKPFANSKGQVRWIDLRTSAHPNSFEKTWREQNLLLGPDEFVPTAGEVVDGMLAYHQIHGEWLFGNLQVRTSDVSSPGFRVIVGSGSKGIHIGSISDDVDVYPFIGLAVARES